MVAACRTPRLIAAAAGRAFTPGRVRPALCLLLPALIITLTAACRSDPSADIEAIRSLIERETAAINSKNLPELAKIWSQKPEILLFDVPPPGRFQGWERIARTFKDFFDRFEELQMTIDSVQVEVRGTFGFATYDWALSGRMEGQTVMDRGQATVIYSREKDGWRLVHAHYSPVPPAVALEADTQKSSPPSSGPVQPPAGTP